MSKGHVPQVELEEPAHAPGPILGGDHVRHHRVVMEGPGQRLGHFGHVGRRDLPDLNHGGEPTLRPMKVGALEVLPVIDGSARVPATAAFVQAGRGSAEEDWEPHRQFVADDGTLELALGGFLIRSGDRTVLVDAGVGNINDGTFMGGQLLDSLAGYGVAPGRRHRRDLHAPALRPRRLGHATRRRRLRERDVPLRRTRLVAFRRS